MSNKTAGAPGTKQAAVTPTKPESSGGPARSTKVKETLQIASTTLSIAGALGTLFVWSAANFYVGDVEVIADHPYQSLVVDVFDHKGQGTTFHTNKFQLMPGKYHVEVSADGKSKQPADVEVQFGKKQQLNICIADNQTPAAQAASTAQTTPAEASRAHHHWWQIWHKKTDQEAGG